jgi:hypothetical protein
MKPLFIFLLITLSIHSLQGQVGFNNPNPHPNSLLDLTATDKGLLIPRLTTVQRDALTLILNPAAESLMVYDTNLQGFYFFRAGTWYGLNEWVKVAGSNNVSLSGNVNITGTINAGNISTSGSISTAGITATGSVESLGGIRTQNSGPFLKTKVIPIGDWNMDVDDTKGVATNVLAAKVRSIYVVIISDLDALSPNNRYPLGAMSINFSFGDSPAGGVGNIFDNSIELYRVQNRLFDGVNVITQFNDTSFNRGWVTIVYEE